MADVKFDRPISRPLSEISENDDLRRMSARVSSYSSSISLKGGVDRISRPASEVLDDSKRVSLSLPVHTITLNLADYTGTSPVASKSAPATVTVAHATAPTPAAPAALSAAARRRSQPPPARPQPMQTSPITLDEAGSSSERFEDAMEDVEEEVVVDLT